MSKSRITAHLIRLGLLVLFMFVPPPSDAMRISTIFAYLWIDLSLRPLD